MKRIDKELPPAPGELSLIQAFLNSAHLDTGSDAWSSPRALAAWLSRHDLLAAATELTEDDLELAKRCRESLRACLAAGDAAGDELTAAFSAAVATAHLQAVYAAGQVRFVPVAGGLSGAIARVLAAFAAVKGEKHWRRFKICASPTCLAAFYDYSTSSSGKWCRPLCGNRLSARRYRRRRTRKR